MKHLKKAFCLLLAAVMLLALGVPVMAAGEIPVDAEHFPDATLRTYVTDYCDTNKDNKLSAAECAAVQCIDLFEMQITKVADMTGIEHFTNQRELLACNNQITTLDLSGMTKLEKLDVSGGAGLLVVVCVRHARNAADVVLADDGVQVHGALLPVRDGAGLLRQVLRAEDRVCGLAVALRGGIECGAAAQVERSSRSTAATTRSPRST